MLDQRFGTIAFSVSHLGLFSSAGEFRRFAAHLVLDGAHPERTQINVEVEAGSVQMSWGEAADMLRSDDFLNVRRYPAMRFTSTSVASVAPDRYVIHGMLQMRGVTRPLTLAARLTGRHTDPVRHDQQADFVVSGSLRRSAFGMTSDEGIISDRVTLKITAHLDLGNDGHAG